MLWSVAKNASSVVTEWSRANVSGRMGLCPTTTSKNFPMMASTSSQDFKMKTLAPLSASSNPALRKCGETMDVKHLSSALRDARACAGRW